MQIRDSSGNQRYTVKRYTLCEVGLLQFWVQIPLSSAVWSSPDGWFCSVERKKNDPIPGPVRDQQQQSNSHAMREWVDNNTKRYTILVCHVSSMGRALAFRVDGPGSIPGPA